jgi:hypothetical protein
MRALRRAFTAQAQRAARRLDPRYLELFYQTSYLDLSRRTPWLEDVPLASPSGGTASFSQLYALLSTLTQYRPARLLEIGVGRSTRLLTQYGSAFAVPSVHVDDSDDWLTSSVGDAPHAVALHAPLAPVSVGAHTVRWYDRRPEGRFDFVLVDGPGSWKRAERYNRLGFMTWLPDVLADEFVVIVDDTSRPGESALVGQIAALCARARTRDIVGANSQTILATPSFAGLLYL